MNLDDKWKLLTLKPELTNDGRERMRGALSFTVLSTNRKPWESLRHGLSYPCQYLQLLSDIVDVRQTNMPIPGLCLLQAARCGTPGQITES